MATLASSQVPATRDVKCKTFHVEIIKPSHYDDDGYLIQWWRAFVPSNSLACMYALAQDVQQRRGLGEDVDIQIHAYDECHTIVPIEKIIRRLRAPGCSGVVLLTGVQSNQFPRASDMARQFRAAGIPVVIGGFHVSGCLSMLPEVPADIHALQEIGVSLFAGEAEGRLAAVLADAQRGQLQPVYNYLQDLPALQGQVTPYLPTEIARKYLYFTAFDGGRGCPFSCSFCTIINVQGRKSRYREADEVEQIIRRYVKNGIKRFFITDDNMARNKNWEAIFDKLIEIRRGGELNVKFVIQVDTQCHKIPGFIEKAVKAGVNRVFIGLENINPDNLAATNKHQNQITEYRRMLQAWRRHGVVTIAGYILGFPADTPESIARDIAVIQEELPIDILEFFILTPLPGSADHRNLHQQGVWMDPDMNKYDLEHVTTGHAKMSAEEWQGIYQRAWHLYYSPAHIETLLRRAEATGSKARRLMWAIVCYYGSYRFEKTHPLQAGIVRRKVRRSRRPDMPRDSVWTFYPRRVLDLLTTAITIGRFVWQLDRLRRRVERDHQAHGYQDRALAPDQGAAEESLQLYELTEAAKVARQRAIVKLQARANPSGNATQQPAPLRRAG